MNTNFSLKPFILLFLTLIGSYLSMLSTDPNFSCLEFLACLLPRKIRSILIILKFLFIYVAMLISLRIQFRFGYVGNMKKSLHQKQWISAKLQITPTCDLHKKKPKLLLEKSPCQKKDWGCG